MPYSLVNIVGLTIGVASVLILLVWISVETSYDKFHKDHERLYRVNLILKTPNKDINSPVINAPAGPEYKREFPVVETSVRFDVKQPYSEYFILTVPFLIFSLLIWQKAIKRLALNPPRVLF
jgi:hypothetical protein